MSRQGAAAPASRLTALFGSAGLDESSSLPLYFQLEQLLRARLRAGKLGPGDRLPTEKELQQHFGISRVTVRQAMDNLVRASLITRRRGSGTVVNRPKIEVELQRIQSFSEVMTSRGYRVRLQVLHQEEIPAGEEIAATLDVVVGHPVTHLQRLCQVDDERIAHFDTYLPPFVGLANRLQGSLYRYLEERGLCPCQAQEQLEAVSAHAALAARLAVPSGFPLLRRTRRTSLQDGRRVEYTIGHYRADRYRYVLTAQR